jgi:glycosyltransferase involved in cell wall biosynthesis
VSELPLVSVLIPTYNRPHYLQIALQSALAQTYNNIEIIVCDDSTNDDVKSMMIPYIQKYPTIKYVKNDTVLFLKNWHKCFEFASGEYINYLMDDDVFHPQKIEKMMSYYLERDDISLVTSYRQVIDHVGNHLTPIPETTRLFEVTTIVDGKDLGNYILTNGRNVIGEPTTVFFRKKDLIEPYGVYQGKQYICLNDIATWLSLLSKGKVVYNPEAFSYFRLHSGQNSRSISIVSTAISEWTDLIDKARKDGFLNNSNLLRAALYTQRNNLQMLRTTDEFKDYKQVIDEVLQRIDKMLLQTV